MKRSLPILSLLLVSFFVFICAAGLIFVLSVDAHTIAEKLQSTLTLGVPFALVLIALLWFGAGIDLVLSRWRKRGMPVILSLLMYVLAPMVLCVGLPALAGTLIYGSMATPIGWKQLPAVPETPVEVASANEISVVVRSDSGTYYSCVTSSPSTCWELSIAPEQSMSGRGTEIMTSPYADPPGKSVDMLGLSYTDMGEEGQVHYAVLEDGSVWVLRKDANKYEAGFATGLFLTIALIPAAAGLLVIYLGAGINAISRSIARSGTASQPKTSVSDSLP
jgi:hypothetical protein